MKFTQIILYPQFHYYFHKITVKSSHFQM